MSCKYFTIVICRLQFALSFEEPEDEAVVEEESAEEDEVFPYMTLPYKSRKGEDIIKTLKDIFLNCWPKISSSDLLIQVEKLRFHFAIKDPGPNEHLSNLVYGLFDDKVHKEIHYVGETKVRFGTKVHEYYETTIIEAISFPKIFFQKNFLSIFKGTVELY